MTRGQGECDPQWEPNSDTLYIFLSFCRKRLSRLPRIRGCRPWRSCGSHSGSRSYGIAFCAQLVIGGRRACVCHHGRMSLRPAPPCRAPFPTRDCVLGSPGRRGGNKTCHQSSRSDKQTSKARRPAAASDEDLFVFALTLPRKKVTQHRHANHAVVTAVVTATRRPYP